MADIRSRRVEIVFMMREFLSLELWRVLNSFCARVEMLLCIGDEVVRLILECPGNGDVVQVLKVGAL
jgi:hypothetical protein